MYGDNKGDWAYEGVFTSPSSKAGGSFGFQVQLVEGWALISSLDEVFDLDSTGGLLLSGTGALHLFKLQDDGHAYNRSIAGPGFLEGDLFAWSLAISGEGLIVGSPGVRNSMGRSGRGAAYWYPSLLSSE